MARTDKSSSRKSKQKPAVIAVDPQTNRAPNADESAPETLVPEIVRTHLTEGSSETSEVERARFIAERAYELARERGFAPGGELDDWLRAEQEFDSHPRQQTPPEDQFTG